MVKVCVTENTPNEVARDESVYYIKMNFYDLQSKVLSYSYGRLVDYYSNMVKYDDSDCILKTGYLELENQKVNETVRENISTLVGVVCECISKGAKKIYLPLYPSLNIFSIRIMSQLLAELRLSKYYKNWNGYLVIYKGEIRCTDG